MRPITFHVADAQMEGGLRAFFDRKDWHITLGCAQFAIDSIDPRDIFRIGGSTDGGMWKRAHEQLALHQHTHERAVIILDEHFEGSPGATKIKRDIEANMLANGWLPNSIEVVVIEPMLEAWLWADHEDVAKAFRFESFEELQMPLIASGLWTLGDPKPIPAKLKEAKNAVLRIGNSKMGRSVFRKLFAQLSGESMNACREPGFQRMRARLQGWFPVEGGAS